MNQGDSLEQNISTVGESCKRKDTEDDVPDDDLSAAQRFTRHSQPPQSSDRP